MSIPHTHQTPLQHTSHFIPEPCLSRNRAMKTLTGRMTVALAALLLFTATPAAHAQRTGYFGSGHEGREPLPTPAVAPPRALTLPLPPIPAPSQRGEKSA